jgi:Flp pilus assembly protein TadD
LKHVIAVMSECYVKQGATRLVRKGERIDVLCNRDAHEAVSSENETFESRDLYAAAEASIKRGNYRRAAALLNDALKISPENPIYLSMLGFCVGTQGNLDAAESICRKAVKRAPQEPIVYVNLGRVLFEQGRRKEAREALMRAYKLDNTSAPAALELSRMGVRRKPMIPLIGRNHPLNVQLGKLRHWIQQRKAKELKKL